MPGIADNILKEFGRVGQPGVQTTTITEPPDKFPLGGIMEMIASLLMSGIFKKKGATDDSSGFLDNLIQQIMGGGNQTGELPGLSGTFYQGNESIAPGFER